MRLARPGGGVAALVAAAALLAPTASAPRPAGWIAIDRIPGVTISTGAAAAADGAARQTAAQQAANTRAINAVLAIGRIVSMRGCQRIEIGGALLFASGSGIVGTPDARCARPTIFMPARAFTRADNSFATRYAADAVGLAVYGRGASPATAVRIAGLHVRSEIADNRSIIAIAALGVRDLAIDDVEISGLPLGVGIAIQSGVHVRIRNPFIHDFHSDTTRPALVANAPNATGIAVGGDEVDGIACDDVRITGARIRDITTGPAFQAANGGDQSDGINVSSPRSNRTVITGFDIRRTAEPIDAFGINGVIADGHIEDAYNFGIKLVHGASGNSVSNVTMVRVGLAGITMQSGPAGDIRAVAGNRFRDIVVAGVDGAGKWAPHDSAGVLITGFGTTALQPHDNRIDNMTIDLGGTGRYGWLDTSHGARNIGRGIRIAGDPGRGGDAVAILHAAGSVALARAALAHPER